jgi:transcriptional regulator with XRE-family HTH domain
MMVRRGDPAVLRHVVTFLRSLTDLTQEEFGRRSRVSQSDVSRFESGLDAPSEEALRRMAKTAGMPWPVVTHLIRFMAGILAAAAHPGWVDNGSEAGQLPRTALSAALLPVARYLLEEEAALRRGPSPEEADREAEQIWTALQAFPAARRRRLIELAPPRSLSGALASLVRAAGEQAGEGDAAEARELGELTRLISQRT